MFIVVLLLSAETFEAWEPSTKGKLFSEVGQHWIEKKCFLPFYSSGS